MFYDRFLALCNINNIKPTAVADAVGLSRMNASRWKKGSVPSSTNLQKLADYFNAPIGYLLGTDDTVTKPIEQPETQSAINDTEIERNRILLTNMLDDVNAIPKENRTEAIREIVSFTQYVLYKYSKPQGQTS